MPGGPSQKGKKEQQQSNNEKTTPTKQVVLDTKWGPFRYLVFAFVLSSDALRFPKKEKEKQGARFMPRSPLESCFIFFFFLSLVQDLKQKYKKKKKKKRKKKFDLFFLNATKLPKPLTIL